MTIIGGLAHFLSSEKMCLTMFASLLFIRRPGQEASAEGNSRHMSKDETERARELVDAVYRSESRQVLATLIRLLGDFDAAEEALHDEIGRAHV